MAYTDQKMSGGKVGAIVIVALIHIALAYAFVTGLAYQYIKKVAKDTKVFDVAPPPPPPPDIPPPPPPPDQKVTPPPVVSPPPIVRVNTPPPPIATVATPPPPQVIAPPQPPTPPRPPAPPTISQQAAAKGDPHQWFSDADYPDAARRANAEGRVSVKLVIGPDGRVASCSVTSGSGNADLDSTTCRVAQRRGRYTAAKDAVGNPTNGSAAFSIRWQLPKE